MQEFFFLMRCRVIKKVGDRLISRNHMLIPLLKIIGPGRVVARQLEPTVLGSLNENLISCAPMCHLPSQTRRDESESVEGPACFSCDWRAYTLAARFFLKTVLPRSAVMSQEHDPFLTPFSPTQQSCLKKMIA